MRVRFVIAATLGTAIAVASVFAPVLAQEQRPRQPFAADPLSVSGDVLEATRLLAVNPPAGIALLQQLNARYPGRDDILARLGYGMQVVGKPDSAAFYYRAALQANPLNLDAGKSLGSIYFSSGKEREAMQIFDRLLEANNYSMGAYKMVAGALRDLGRIDEAISVLEEGRGKSKKNAGLSLEIANLYKQSGNPKRAMDEYFSYAATDARAYRFAREKMLEILNDAGPDEGAIVAYLRTRADARGTGAFAASDVLAAYYLQKGQLESSLEMALRADEDQAADGASLLVLTEESLSRAETQPRNSRARYLDLALRSSESYVRNHPNSPGLDRAMFALAGIYAEYGSGANPALPAAERTAYLERAVAQYADVSKRFGGSDLAERAYVARGDVLLYDLKRPDAALDAYRSGAVNSRRLGGEFAGRIARVFIGTGRTKDAEHYIASLSRAGNPELAQAGQYYTGLYLATQKKYELARDTLTALAEGAPSSAFTNDAIEAAWVIEEGLMLKSGSLDDFVAAEKAAMVGDTTAIVSKYQAIAGREIHDPLRPRALHRLGLLYFDQGAFDTALATLQGFLKDYPKEDDCPAVTRDVGRVYEVGLGDYNQALKEYEKILLSYPEYAMLDDVRRDVQRVRSLVKGSYAP
ncbi:MAG TPA: tetratricopeptide repeat protein [Candidatus Krumholzibacteria bacterium]|nr:tetratricopeptide repeat protein [Candidatus Krumholzibacteria bacterium]